MEHTGGQLQLAGGQVEQRAAERGFRNRLVHLCLVLGRRGHVGRAFRRDAVLAEHVEPAADRPSAVGREQQFLVLRDQRDPVLPLGSLVATGLGVDVVAPVREHLSAQADRELQHFPVVLCRTRAEHGRTGEKTERHARVGAGLGEGAHVRRHVWIAHRHQQDAGVRGRQLARRAVIGVDRLGVRLGGCGNARTGPAGTATSARAATARPSAVPCCRLRAGRCT